jgi:general secretion pathway protein A
MMRRTRGLLIAFLVGTLFWGHVPTVSGSSAESESTETGRLIAILLDSGRTTIALNQSLINDKTRGDKGFTPEVFEQQLFGVFRERTGIDLASLTQAQIPEMAKPLLKRLVEESKKTLASYQTVINLPGLAYKGLIPATFGTETAARFQVWSGIYLKQTAPSHLLRNPKNKPDEYELTVLERLASSDRPQQNDTTVSETLEREKTVRVILPLYYGKACLSCHGEPRGERDITGYPREGGREGELGGAISVKLPLQ